jgi:hypothetical protein
VAIGWDEVRDGAGERRGRRSPSRKYAKGKRARARANIYHEPPERSVRRELLISKLVGGWSGGRRPLVIHSSHAVERAISLRAVDPLYLLPAVPKLQFASACPAFTQFSVPREHSIDL